MSVKVAVRVRPFNATEISKGSKCAVEMEGPMTILTNPKGGDAVNKDGVRKFTFDYSFWSHDGFTVNDSGYSEPDGPDSPYDDQAKVYNALGKQVLENAWQGYHCCLFAYGQTGSGKSYSMVGYGANKGIVPQACDEIFAKIALNQDTSMRYEVQFSMLEIYNEKVQDLLQKDQNMKPAGGLKVRQDKRKGIYVENLTKFPVDSYESIAAKMEEGYTARSIGATLMNQTSSRAHTVITIEFKQIRQEEGRKVEKFSCINLVDLAGSEKSGQTGAEGQRFKEGAAINKSLTVLGQCISVLAEQSQGKTGGVVPYRDSNLTRILQNALGGNSKTIMICSISPSGTYYEETLSTLRYADRAKQIVNKAVVNESVQDKIIRELREENDKLKKILMEAAKKGGVIDINSLGLGSTEELVANMEAADEQLKEMETPWEERLAEARRKDEDEKKQRALDDKRAPHLTNLNEDSQLTGKMHYSLADLHDTPVFIGRPGSDPASQITLRGAGVQELHAMFKVDDYGRISIVVKGEDAANNTLVNGAKLPPARGNFVSTQSSTLSQLATEGPEFTQILNHMDRICIGHGMLFLFRYPLQKLRRLQATQAMLEKNPEIDEDELEARYEAMVETEGLAKDVSDLVAKEYTAEQVAEDDATTLEAFEAAYEESRREEQARTDQKIAAVQMQEEAERERMEQTFQEQMKAWRAEEDARKMSLMRQKDETEAKMRATTDSLKEASEAAKAEAEAKAQELDKMRAEIEAQNAEKERLLQEQRDELMRAFAIEREELEKKRRETRRQTALVQKHKGLLKQISEACEICKRLNKNIKFKPFIMKMAVDDTGRRMSVTQAKAEEIMNAKTVEDVKVQVDNLDNGVTMMWSVEQFEDKLVMMRDKLAQHEEQAAAKAKADAKAEELKAEEEKKEKEAAASLKDEIFGNDVPDYDFDKDFDIEQAVDLETAFSDFGDIKKVVEQRGQRARATVMPRKGPKKPMPAGRERSGTIASFAADRAAAMGLDQQPITLEGTEGLEAFQEAEEKKEGELRAELTAEDLGAFDAIVAQQEKDEEDRASAFGEQAILRRATTIKKRDYAEEEDFDKPIYQKLDQVIVRQEFLERVLSQYTPLHVQASIYIKPVPKSVGRVHCTVLRDASTFKLTNRYYLRLADADTPLLTGEKQAQSLTKHYKIKIDSRHLKYRLSEEELYVARLRANFNSDTFHIFDNGKNPRDLRPGQRLMPNENLRRQYGTVLYRDTDRNGKKVERHIEAYVPRVAEETGSNVAYAWPDTERKKIHIYREFEEQKASGADLKQDRGFGVYNDVMTPEFAKTMTAHMDMYHSIEDATVLNFNGVVAKPSKKNFQLVSCEKPQTGQPAQEDVLCQFGRISDDMFHMEVQYPLSLVQAFGICLSAFEYKV